MEMADSASLHIQPSTATVVAPLGPQIGAGSAFPGVAREGMRLYLGAVDGQAARRYSDRRMKLDHPRVKLRCRGRRLAAIALACGALIALPAAGQAAVVTLGSDLTKPADVVEDHGADAVFWPITIDGGGGAVP